MEEKVFTILYRLISSGQLPKEEAFYMMKLLFERKENVFRDWPVANPTISPVTIPNPVTPWYGTSITASPVDCVYTTTTAPTINAEYTTTASKVPEGVTCTSTAGDVETKFETTTTIE